jgi:TonB family protein
MGYSDEDWRAPVDRTAGIETPPSPAEKLSLLAKWMLPWVFLAGLGWIFYNFEKILPNGLVVSGSHTERGVIISSDRHPGEAMFIKDRALLRNIGRDDPADAGAGCITLPAGNSTPTMSHVAITRTLYFGKFSCGQTLFGLGLQRRVTRLEIIEPITCSLSTFGKGRLSCTPAAPPADSEALPGETFTRPLPPLSPDDSDEPDRRFGPFKVRFNNPPKPLSGDPKDMSSYYPVTSIRNAEEGTTAVEVFFSADGVARSCEVIQSSGHEALDAQTCELVGHHPMFTRVSPNVARNENGEVILRQRMTWRLP